MVKIFRNFDVSASALTAERLREWILYLPMWLMPIPLEHSCGADQQIKEEWRQAKGGRATTRKNFQLQSILYLNDNPDANATW